jgi:hypothetical protein
MLSDLEASDEDDVMRNLHTFEGANFLAVPDMRATLQTGDC